jgi:hypothetical protein
MRWAFLITLPLLSLGLALAQPPQPPPPQPATPGADKPQQLVENARILYVARELRLRQDQLQKLLPLLAEAQDAIQQRNATYDDLWAKGQSAFVAVDGAVIAGRQTPQTNINALQRVIAASDAARKQADEQVQRIANQLLALLDKQQLTHLELPQQQGAGQGQQEARDLQIAQDIARYASAMRQLLPDEYDSLRVAMALRLAERLVAPDQQGFDNMVGNVLRILDTVRRLNDAEFAQREPQLPVSVAQALRLPLPQPNEVRPVSWDDVMVFVTSPATVGLLETFKADPAMEVAP